MAETWDATKPPHGGPRLSAELRQNWRSLERQLSRNLALDPRFLAWTIGGAPVFWDYSGSGASVDQCGPGESDTTEFGLGGYALKLTYGSALARAFQVRVATLPTYWRGKQISLGAIGLASSLNIARFYVDDGDAVTYSDYIPTTTEDWRTLTHVFSASATKLEIGVELTSGEVYVEGFTLCYGPIPPMWFMPEEPAFLEGVPRAGEPTVLYKAQNTILSAGAGFIDGHSATIDFDRWFSRPGDELLIETWGYVGAASTWSIRHSVNGARIHDHQFTDYGFGAAVIHFHFRSRWVFVTATTQQVFSSQKQYHPGSGTHTDYMVYVPTTSNPNGAITVGTGNVVVKEELSDADNSIRSHGFKITATPKAA